MAADLEQRLTVIRDKARGRGLGPVLNEVRVAGFEASVGVRLPEGYRRFLLEVGSSGSGPPHYGLLGLGEVPDDHELSAKEQLSLLSRPFPLTRAWVWEDEDLTPERQALRDRVGDGTLVLGTDGCGQYWHLVVTGEERGQMWHIAGEGAGPCVPGMDFLAWYEHWLDGRDDWWAGLKQV